MTGIMELHHIFNGTSKAMTQKTKELMYDVPRKLVPKTEYHGVTPKLSKSEQRMIFEYKKLIFNMNKRIKDLEMEKSYLSPVDSSEIAAIDANIRECLKEIAFDKNVIRGIKMSAFNNQKAIDEII